MTTAEIAHRLVELCRAGKDNQALEELYAADAVSIEPEGSPNPRAEGMEAILKKGEEFSQMIEAYHGNNVSDPIVSDDFFSVSMELDVTMKGYGRIPMREICLYEVKDGKIVREQFFYRVEAGEPTP